MNTRNLFVFLAAMMLILVGAGAASATTYEVDTVGELQTAINSASSGDYIHLADGTYTLTSAIDIDSKSEVVIYGDGYDQCTVTTQVVEWTSTKIT